MRYYFNNITGQCDSFIYGGCDGNGNNFLTKELCEIECVSTDPDCICPMYYDPVCGADGKTYGNECEASCKKVTVLHQGMCGKKECICPMIYDPVCGDDGNNYNNECEAKCKNAKVVSRGECSSGCVCPMVYSPVCGSDGKNYPNECEANCKNVKVVYEGMCQKKEKKY